MFVFLTSSILTDVYNPGKKLLHEFVVLMVRLLLVTDDL